MSKKQEVYALLTLLGQEVDGEEPTGDGYGTVLKLDGGYKVNVYKDKAHCQGSNGPVLEEINDALKSDSARAYVQRLGSLRDVALSKPDQVAIMMPFHKVRDSEPRDVLAAIKQGVKAAGMKPLRVDDMRGQDILENLRELLRSSGTVIVDITGMNPNVLYELGYAQALGKTIVLIQEGEVIERLPFDICSLKVLSYCSGRLGSLSDELQAELKARKLAS